MKKLILALLVPMSLVMFSFTFQPSCDVDYKNLSYSDKRVLDQKIKSCGCPVKVYKIKEYAVYSPSKADRLLSGSVKSSSNSVVAVRSGWAYDFNSCKRIRIWSDTGANGKLYKQSTNSVESWVGKRIDGIKVEENFGSEW